MNEHTIKEKVALTNHLSWSNYNSFDLCQVVVRWEYQASLTVQLKIKNEKGTLTSCGFHTIFLFPEYVVLFLHLFWLTDKYHRTNN